MRIHHLFFFLILVPAAATAEVWTQVESPDKAISLEYSQESIRPVTPTIKRAKARFSSTTGQTMMGTGAYSVVGEVEFHCVQPLEKILSAELVLAPGATPILQKEPVPVFAEIRHGSNSFRFWRAICFDQYRKEKYHAGHPGNIEVIHFRLPYEGGQHGEKDSNRN